MDQSHGGREGGEGVGVLEDDADEFVEDRGAVDARIREPFPAARWLTWKWIAAARSQGMPLVRTSSLRGHGRGKVSDEKLSIPVDRWVRTTGWRLR